MDFKPVRDTKSFEEAHAFYTPIMTALEKRMRSIEHPTKETTKQIEEEVAKEFGITKEEVQNIWSDMMIMLEGMERPVNEKLKNKTMKKAAKEFAEENPDFNRSPDEAAEQIEVIMNLLRPIVKDKYLSCNYISIKEAKEATSDYVDMMKRLAEENDQEQKKIFGKNKEKIMEIIGKYHQGMRDLKQKYGYANLWMVAGRIINLIVERSNK